MTNRMDGYHKAIVNFSLHADSEADIIKAATIAGQFQATSLDDALEIILSEAFYALYARHPEVKRLIEHCAPHYTDSYFCGEEDEI